MSNNQGQVDGFVGELTSAKRIEKHFVHDLACWVAGAPLDSAVAEAFQVADGCKLNSVYRGTSLIRNSAPLGPYSRSMPRAPWWSYGGGLFLMSVVPLHHDTDSVLDL